MKTNHPPYCVAFNDNLCFSNNVEKPVKIILTGDDALRSQYVPPEPTVKILKRPSKDVQNSNDSKVYQPKKTLRQREQEYAEARLRILGEASPEKTDEKYVLLYRKPLLLLNFFDVCNKGLKNCFSF